MNPDRRQPDAERRQGDSDRAQRAVTTLDLVQKVWQFVKGAGAFIAAVAIVGWTAAGYVYGSRAVDAETQNTIRRIDTNGTTAFESFLTNEQAYREKMDARWQEIRERLVRIDERLK